MLLEWVNPIYLDISHQEQIQQKFEDSSEIQLKGFLKVNPYHFCPDLHESTCFYRVLWVDRRRSLERWATPCSSLRFSGPGRVLPIRGKVSLSMSLISSDFFKDLKKMPYLKKIKKSKMSALTVGAMTWPLWVTCHSVWGNAGSFFIPRLFSCFCPTLPAFAYTTFVLMMRMMTKNRTQRPEGPRSRTTPRL